MSKKESALGSIPTFENVARATEDLDLFKEEPKAEEKTISQDELKKKILADAMKKKEEQRPKQEQDKKKIVETITKNLEEEPKEPITEAGQKPSTKKGVRTGYKRQTFVIRDDLLEMIQALCSYNDLMQVDLLEALIEKGLADISEETKEKALASYRKEQNKDKKEETKKEIAKLFN